MTKVRELHEQWMKDPEYRAEYEGMGPEFELAQSLIEARSRAGLTQSELARRMKTTQSVIARMEGGRVIPSTRTLERFAKATGMRLKISFEPERTNMHEG
jgi:ribosome-binding protein aMBF1 (putative translation factor)